MTTTKTKRPRKQKVQTDTEPKMEMNPEFQKQGMSTAWQHFYAKVKQATRESRS